MVGQEVDSCIEEAGQIDPAWRDVIFRQAVQCYRMQQQQQEEKKEIKKAVISEKKEKEREEKRKEIERRVEIERKLQEELAALLLAFALEEASSFKSASIAFCAAR